MIYRDIREEFIHRPYLVGIDGDGHFTSYEPTAILSSEVPLRGITSIVSDSEPHQVLMGVTQFHHIHINDAQPPFITHGKVDHRFFLKTGPGDENPEQCRFTAVSALTIDSALMGPKALEIIRFVPEQEWAKFGIASLKRLIR